MVDNAKQYSADAWPPASEECLAGTVWIESGCLCFSDEHQTGAIPLKELYIEAQGNGADTIHFSSQKESDGWVFACGPEIFSEPVLKGMNNLRQQIREIESRRSDWKRLKLTLWAFAGIGVLTLVISFGGSLILNLVVDRVSVAYENQLGDEFVKEIEGDDGIFTLNVIEAPETVAGLKEQTERLLAVKPAWKGAPCTIKIYHSPIPNAMAVLGGHYYVSTGLLSLMKTPEELAGVLAHETAHMKHRDGLRGLFAQKGSMFMLNWLFGNQNSTMSLMSKSAELLTHLNYSRKLEFAADDAGWDMLVAANIDPRGEIDAFRKLDLFHSMDKEEEKMARALSDHPLTMERIVRLEGKWKKLSKKTDFTPLAPVPWTSPSDEQLREAFKKTSKNSH